MTVGGQASCRGPEVKPRSPQNFNSDGLVSFAYCPGVAHSGGQLKSKHHRPLQDPHHSLLEDPPNLVIEVHLR